ncbi:unannotated protein [freshwater metagenome]|uniref:Unannotated protein n=1 Tax=freshwater metagenome TaxID=449393 RepID=A0A6J6EUC1_9ZZZZ
MAALVRGSKTRSGQGDHSLLERPRDDPGARSVGNRNAVHRSPRCGRRGVCEIPARAPQSRQDARHNIGVLERAGSAHHEFVRSVVGVIVAEHRRTLRGLDRLGVSTNRATQSMVAEHEFGNALVSDITGIIISHRELFQNDLPLDLKFVGVNHGIDNHVGEDVDGHVHIGVLNLRVVAGVFFGSEGIVLAAHRIKGNGDIECASGRGAFEQQMLEEVCGAIGDVIFITRAHRNPKP